MATITVQDLATELGTDGRTARKFLRSITPKDAQPGKGGRWSIEKKDLRSMKSQFTKFTAAAEAKANAKANDEGEPTADDLAEIEANEVD